MDGYFAHPDTLEYVGSKKLNRDPQKSKRLGMDWYAVPKNCTIVKPHIASANQVNVLKDPNINDGEWELVEDFRGDFYDCDTKELITVESIGQPKPENSTDAKPGEFDIWGGDAWIFNIPDYKASKQAQVDSFADSVFFTFASGPRSIEYTYTAQKARDFVASPTSDEECPQCIKTAAEVEGVTLAEAAELLCSMADAYETALESLRDIRLKAKAAIFNAPGKSEVDAVFDQAVADMEALKND